VLHRSRRQGLARLRLHLGLIDRSGYFFAAAAFFLVA
jgi:hypothetical protein